MTAEKAILGLATMGQATALAAYNYPLTKKGKFKKIGVRDIVSKGIGTVAGIGLMKETANAVAGF
jgi:hypothetical protein